MGRWNTYFCTQNSLSDIKLEIKERIARRCQLLGSWDEKLDLNPTAIYFSRSTQDWSAVKSSPTRSCGFNFTTSPRNRSSRKSPTKRTQPWAKASPKRKRATRTTPTTPKFRRRPQGIQPIRTPPAKSLNHPDMEKYVTNGSLKLKLSPSQSLPHFAVSPCASPRPRPYRTRRPSSASPKRKIWSTPEETPSVGSPRPLSTRHFRSPGAITKSGSGPSRASTTKGLASSQLGYERVESLQRYELDQTSKYYLQEKERRAT